MNYMSLIRRKHTKMKFALGPSRTFNDELYANIQLQTCPLYCATAKLTTNYNTEIINWQHVYVTLPLNAYLSYKYENCKQVSHQYGSPFSRKFWRQFVEQSPTTGLSISHLRWAICCSSVCDWDTAILYHTSMNGATARHHAGKASCRLRRRYIRLLRPWHRCRCHATDIFSATDYLQQIKYWQSHAE